MVSRIHFFSSSDIVDPNITWEIQPCWRLSGLLCKEFCIDTTIPYVLIYKNKRKNDVFYTRRNIRLTNTKRLWANNFGLVGSVTMTPTPETLHSPSTPILGVFFVGVSRRKGGDGTLLCHSFEGDTSSSWSGLWLRQPRNLEPEWSEVFTFFIERKQILGGSSTIKQFSWVYYSY